MIQIPKEGEYVKLKNYERKIKSCFMHILKVFWCQKIMKNKIQVNLILANIKTSYKLACTDDKSSTYFKYYLGEDAVYNFINSMMEESKYCTDIMKKSV